MIKFWVMMRKQKKKMIMSYKIFILYAIIFLVRFRRLKMKKVKFIDLFAGLGGIRLSFEQAFKELGYETECVLC